MTKAFLRCVAFLSILLVHGYPSPSADAQSERTLGSWDQVAGRSSALTLVTVDATREGQPLVAPASSSGPQKPIIVETSEVIEEKEDDESLHSKRYVANSHFFTTLFYTCLSEYSSHSAKKRLSSYRHFSFVSSLAPRYLVLRVFRI